MSKVTMDHNWRTLVFRSSCWTTWAIGSALHIHSMLLLSSQIRVVCFQKTRSKWEFTFSLPIVKSWLSMSGTTLCQSGTTLKARYPQCSWEGVSDLLLVAHLYLAASGDALMGFECRLVFCNDIRPWSTAWTSGRYKNWKRSGRAQKM